MKRIYTLGLVCLLSALTIKVQAQWTKKADFPSKGKTTSFAINDAGYVLSGDSTNNFWKYDPSSNTWMPLADFPGAPRVSAVGFAIGNTGYIGTGHNSRKSTPVYADFWAYDPATNTWTEKAPLPGGARAEASGFSIGNKGYLGGGGLSDFWEYDPAGNTWTRKADIGAGAIRFAPAFS